MAWKRYGKPLYRLRRSPCASALSGEGGAVKIGVISPFRAMKSFLTLFVFLSASALAFANAVSVQINGEPLTLTPDAEARMVRQIEAVIASCSVDSKHHRGIFRRLPREGKEISRDSCLKVTYPETKKIASKVGEFSIREVVIVIGAKERYLGPVYLIKENDQVILLSKYNGLEIISLASDEALFPHLPERMQKAAQRATAQAGR